MMVRLKRIILSFFVLGVLAVSTDSYAALYQVDPVYSSVIFKIQHLAGYTVGLFRNFAGKIELSDDNNKVVSLEATVDIRSIYTRNNQRDRDLRSPMIFDAKKFPKAQFTAKKIDEKKMIGDLTIKDKTKEVTLDYTIGGVTKDQWGHTKVALSAKGVISRKDFGIAYNRKLDDGQMLLGDQVELQIEMEGILQQ